MELSARVRDTSLHTSHGDDVYDRLYKVILVGDSGTGKSQLVARFTQNTFSEAVQPTIIMEHTRKILIKRRICAHIWDMAGREMFKSITSCYYKCAAGAIVVYNIAKVRTFEHATQWLEHLRQTLGSNCVIMLVGNKLDLRRHRSVTSEEGARLAKSFNALFIETSACDATNVQKCFLRLIDCITEKLDQAELKQKVESGGGLESGSKALTETGRENVGVIKVVQSQPTSKFSFRQATQKCLEGAKETCYKLPCCFY